MELISLGTVCRCCLASAGTFSSIFEIYNDYYLPKVIHACTGLAIQQSDGLPEVVCESCLAKLVAAYETRRLFLRSNGQLREQLNRLRQSEQEILTELNYCTVVKDEEQGDATVADESSGSNPLSDDILTWDNEINEHIEQLQDGSGELAGDIEDSLDELVIEKCENLEKGGFSFPLVEPVGKSGEDEGSNTSFKDECPEVETLPLFSESSETSEEESDEIDSSQVKAEEEEAQDCPICGKTFRNARLLQRHVQYHSNKKSDCPICSRSFSHTSNLKRHLNSHKPPEGGLCCPKCPGKFEKGTQLYNHLKIHKSPSDSNSYRMQCEACEMETTSLAGFIYHMSQEHGVPKDQVKAFRCHLCPLRFVSKQGMFRHIQAVHQNLKPPPENHSRKFLCTECGKSFRRMKHLETHTNSHAGIRPHHCAECNLYFAQKSSLNIHIRVKHQHQKRHVCAVCRKSFAQATHLKDHELIHTGRKEHQCPICRHRFHVKSNLMAHMKTHRRRPYYGRDCDSQFRHSTRLEQHTATEHAGEMEN
ncbi:gastrula zinc finger protein XlCGF57.1-like [Aedes albopictus]|uniref:C2h2-type zn-finger protein n=1 Tax=Aedes albopictus TaxID=7160 RepID=A0ABM2A164_AEDAL